MSSARPSASSVDGPAPSGEPGLDAPARRRIRLARPNVSGRDASRHVFIWPALLVILFLSVFPFVASLYLSLSRMKFTANGVQINFIGLQNFQTLIFGSERTHFLGLMAPPSPVGWAVFGAMIVLVAWGLRRAWRGGIRGIGLVGRTLGGLLLLGLTWLLVQTILGEGGRPGTLMVTLTYVYVGIAVQYLLGLGLALLVTQRLPGRRFFRVVFLLPMMITPVGVAYMFRMLADTGKGPLVPLFDALGMEGWTWVNDPWLARIMVMLADAWQWTPFMFIVLLAALEAQDVQVVEAAQVDGATHRQVFSHITFWAILPVTTTLILIRMIEAFKIVDLPNVFTRGGPGTATESMTLQALFDWRTLNLGRSAAISYTLLIVVTIAATAFVRLTRRTPTPTDVRA